jgi:hypothetical protein
MRPCLPRAHAASDPFPQDLPGAGRLADRAAAQLRRPLDPCAAAWAGLLRGRDRDPPHGLARAAGAQALRRQRRLEEPARQRRHLAPPADGPAGGRDRRARWRRRAAAAALVQVPCDARSPGAGTARPAAGHIRQRPTDPAAFIVIAVVVASLVTSTRPAAPPAAGDAAAVVLSRSARDGRFDLPAAGRARRPGACAWSARASTWRTRRACRSAVAARSSATSR